MVPWGRSLWSHGSRLYSTGLPVTSRYISSDANTAIVSYLAIGDVCHLPPPNDSEVVLGDRLCVGGGRVAVGTQMVMNMGLEALNACFLPGSTRAPAVAQLLPAP